MQKEKSEYSKKFLDPRWQKIRLQVFERDEFTCIECGDNESTLNVHHTYYEFGKDPWEYPLESFKTLCVDCHEGEYYSQIHFKELVRGLLQNGAMYQDLVQMLAGLEAPSERFTITERARFASFAGMHDDTLEEIKNKLSYIPEDAEF